MTSVITILLGASAILIVSAITNCSILTTFHNIINNNNINNACDQGTTKNNSKDSSTSQIQQTPLPNGVLV